MGVGRSVVRGAVATSAVALPLLVMGSPASAAEGYGREVLADHTFTDFAGDEVTCTVQYRSELRREDTSTPFSAVTATEVFVIDPLSIEACRASVGVDTTYPDPAGAQRRARAFGNDEVELQLAEVQGNYTTTHSVVFLNCSADCETTRVTTPK
jgi:hypothetical protein